LRRPAKDEQSPQSLLAMLGQFPIANNLNQIARAVIIGTLPVRAQTERDFLRACAKKSSVGAWSCCERSVSAPFGAVMIPRQYCWMRP
jgi:hypothetical protein